MTTLLLSSGVPMLLMGDEFLRTQNGNNNPYCQDNELSWLSWQRDERQTKFHEFVRDLIHLRKSEAVFEYRHFFTGERCPVSGKKDLAWYSPKGVEFTQSDWENPDLHALGMLLSGVSIHEYDHRGDILRGNSLLLLFNASWQSVSFLLPWASFLHPWELVVDTNEEKPFLKQRLSRFKRSYDLAPWSLAVLRFYE